MARPSGRSARAVTGGRLNKNARAQVSDAPAEVLQGASANQPHIEAVRQLYSLRQLVMLRPLPWRGGRLSCENDRGRWRPHGVPWRARASGPFAKCVCNWPITAGLAGGPRTPSDAYCSAQCALAAHREDRRRARRTSRCLLGTGGTFVTGSSSTVVTASRRSTARPTERRCP